MHLEIKANNKITFLNYMNTFKRLSYCLSHRFVNGMIWSQKITKRDSTFIVSCIQKCSNVQHGVLQRCKKMNSNGSRGSI